MKKAVSVSGNKFVDRMGHEIKLHGINMVCKEKNLNYLGNYSLKDFEWIKEQGFNTVRFGIFWDAIEPLPGQFNEEYLQGIDKIIEYAGQCGIFIYLDMHQDLFSADFCDGAPSWATLTEGTEYIETELWSEAYLVSPAVQTAFDSFWTDAPASDGIGVRTHFVRMWKMLADRYKDSEYVIGYDFFNEPFLGSMAVNVMPILFMKIAEELGEENPERILELWSDPASQLELLDKFSEASAYEKIIRAPEAVTRDFDVNILNPFYNELRKAVREADKESILFLETNYFCNTGIESFVEALYDENGAKDPYQAYCPHGYDLLVDTDAYDRPCEGRLNVIFDTHKKVGDRLGLPVIIGEWGCFPNANETQVGLAKLIRSIFDRNGFSDTYYDYSTLKGNPVLESLK